MKLRAVTRADIEEFASWRSDPPYDVYDITDPIEQAVDYFLRPQTGCHVIELGPNLAAFFTFGADARVPGGDYSKPALDIGLGVRPSLTGRGLGGGFVGAVVAFARGQTVDPLRVTIATANQRAITVWRRAGFVETQRFQAAETVLGSDEFVVLELA
ncbi:MAG: GNAT family N-acetyltransferase [Acidimicrobiia bacterium]|nr:GNAT family N-acetyltransferase [Acidimicrobiia bacterium]MBT8216115.1 GNAT family N-acetyltransferase [Acidimicrobiia bacterium]NNF09894.1 GNAT family N-acetyltransferase [Acidimicrobiia bacterium]NNL70521.1 GNAT family N-acetyltransferase [Acidimicrobiia bacterium]